MALSRGSASGPTRSAVPRKRGRLSREAIVGLVFLAPAVLINLIVVAGPALVGLALSLTRWTGLGTPEFIGLANFQRLFFHDDVFWIAFFNNVRWTIMFMTIPISLALLGASLVAGITKGQLVYRMILFMPVVIATVIRARVWQQIFHPRMGIGPWLAERGVPWLDLRFFGDPDIALYSIAFVDNWGWWGFPLVVLLTAMQQVDPSFYEAARIEGANRIQQFFSITLPLIRPTVVFLMMMTVIWSFLVFDYVYILTGGGPGTSTEVLGLFLYKRAFYTFQSGYAAAIGATITVIVVLVVTIQALLRRKGWEI